MFRHIKSVSDMYGRKPNNISEDAHLEQLNKMVMDACVKEIIGNKQQYQQNNGNTNMIFVIFILF